ncbi:MAG: hypothetical protein HY466_02785, partial [Deltaproteobacteria bacterium]|nr:hypothetical protein [Deltaproteobacteria bacterium]
MINFRHLTFKNRCFFAPAGLASILQGLVFVRRLFFCLWLIFLPAGVARPADLQNAISKEEAYHLAEAVQMQGLDRFIGDQAKASLRGKLGGKIVEWAAEGMEEILGRTTDHGPFDKAQGRLRTTDLGQDNLKELFKKDPELSKKLKAKIQQKLRTWLPGQLKNIIQKDLLQGDSEREIFAELDKTLNEQADRWIGGWYDGAMEKIRQDILNVGAAPLSVKNFSELFGSIPLDGYLSERLGEAIGQSAARGLQNSLFSVLRGELPEEAMQSLRMGPDKFAQYVEKGRAYLPGAQFRKFKNKMMQLHVVDLPNQVYGGILAASGAMHLAKFSSSCSGFFATCNWNELKRAKEVFETMVWQ